MAVMMSVEFGNTLAAIRESRSLLRNRLARLAAIDPSTVTRLESGERSASRDVVERLAVALDASDEERRALFATAGFLPDDAATVLDEPKLTRLALILANRGMKLGDRRTLMTYIELAISHAEALGYDVPS